MARMAFVLLLLNIGLWVGAARLSAPVSVISHSGTLPRVGSLKPGSDADQPRAQCVAFRLGWFDTRAKAADALARFSVHGQVLAVERELPPLNWILIPPQPFEAARNQFRELYLAGVDAYIVSDGEYRNAISLGLFESEVAANTVLEEKKREKLNVVLAKFPRNRLGYALAFEVGPDVETQWLQSVEADIERKFEFIERNACKGVASSKKSP